MLRYKVIPVDSATTGTHLTNALAGIGERDRIIRALKVRNVRAVTAITDVIDELKIIALRDQDQILEGKLGSFVHGQASTADYLYSEALFTLDLPLKQGEGFQVGAYIGDTADNPEITMIYEDK